MRSGSVGELCTAASSPRYMSLAEYCRCVGKSPSPSPACCRSYAFRTDLQGERRFWLGAMVDDLFLETPAFNFSGSSDTVIAFDGVGDISNEGDKVRRVVQCVSGGGSSASSMARRRTGRGRFHRDPRTPETRLGVSWCPTPNS